MKRGAAIAFEFDVKRTEHTGDGHDSPPTELRPTAADHALVRFAERRAEDLGLNWRELLAEIGVRDRAGIHRVKKLGLTTKQLRAIEKRLDDIEHDRGVTASRGTQLREWIAVGAELLTLDDDSQLFRDMLAGVTDNLRNAKKLAESRATFRRKAVEPKSGDDEENGSD